MRRREVLTLLTEIERRNAALRDEIDKRHAQRSQDQQKAVDAALAAQEKAVAAALGAAERAVLKAEVAAEKRFEGVNEFRQTLSDQATHLMPRAEAQVEFSSLRSKIGDLVTRMDKGEGKGAGMNALWGYIVGGIMLLLALWSKLGK